MDDPLRVLIVDDHPVVRQGLRTFLGTRDGISVVAEAGDGETAVAKARAARPDVVVLDLVMPGIGGEEAVRRIVADNPDVRVLVLTSFGDDSQVVRAVRAGAAGYLLKDADPGQVEEAVRAVARGEALVHPRVAGALMREVTASAPAPLSSLTPREAEVLTLLGEGLTNRRIARTLGVAEKTVKTHVSAVLAKLGLADRTQAALYAVREGLVDGDREAGGPRT